MIIENFQAEFCLWILLRMATKCLVRNTVTVNLIVARCIS